MAQAITVTAFYVDGVSQSPSLAYVVLVDNITDLLVAEGDSNIAPEVTEAAVHSRFYDESSANGPKLVFASQTVAAIAALANG